MEEREFSRCVEIKQIVDPNAQVIVNGRIQQQATTVLCCPFCGNVVMTLGNNVPEAVALKYCTSNKQQLQSQLCYCPRCTQRIRVPEIVAEAHIDRDDKNDREE